MDTNFGHLLREYRREADLTLREFAERAEMDPGNLSKIERDRLDPPQHPEILNRLCLALGQALDAPRAQRLRDLAAVQTGRIPSDILGNDEVMRWLPCLLRAVHERQRSGTPVERLIQGIRSA